MDVGGTMRVWAMGDVCAVESERRVRCVAENDLTQKCSLRRGRSRVRRTRSAWC